MNIIKKEKGFTLIEVLIATFLSGLLISGGFSFYSKMQNQTTIQMEMSDIQNIARSSIDDISSTLRQAGYKLDGHIPYEINGNTLSVFFNMYNTVDTVSYFLSHSETASGIEDAEGEGSEGEGSEGEGSEGEGSESEGSTEENSTFYLMKSCSYGNTSVYADNIVSITFLQIEENMLKVTITAQTEYPDESYQTNNGYRTWSISEVICLRNI